MMVLLFLAVGMRMPPWRLRLGISMCIRARYIEFFALRLFVAFLAQQRHPSRISPGNNTNLFGTGPVNMLLPRFLQSNGSYHHTIRRSYK
jgi:hypothetical protein